MNWFGRKSAGRDASRPVLSRGFGSWIGAGAGVAGGGDWPQGYEAQVRAGYIANPVAQRAVRLVAEAVAGAPVTASDSSIHSSSQPNYALVLRLVPRIDV